VESFIIIYLAVFACLVSVIIALWVVVLRAVRRDADHWGGTHAEPPRSSAATNRSS
jgi:hypothetical protein